MSDNNEFDPLNTDTSRFGESIFQEEDNEPETEPNSEPENIPSVNDVAEEIPPKPVAQESSPEQTDDNRDSGTYRYNAGANDDYAPYGNGAPQGGDYQGQNYGNGGYQGTNYGAGGFQGQAPKQESATLGVLSLIFGIVSLVFFCSCFNIITGIFAIVFGIIQLVNNKHTGRGLAIAGIITAAISIVAFFGFWGIVGSSMHDSMNDMDMGEFWEDYNDLLREYGIEIEGGNGTVNPPAPGNDTQQL